jgi:hypothetical protein
MHVRETKNISWEKFSSVDEQKVLSKEKLKPLVEARNIQTKHVARKTFSPSFQQ